MRYFSLVILTGALMLLPPATADAIPLTFVVTLSGLNENPPTGSPGTGSGIIVLDPTAHTLQLSVTFSGLTATDTAAHIHCCAFPPTNAGVATTVPAFPGFPLGVTSGSYTSAVFDLTQPLIYNPAFITAQGGQAQAEAALVAGIQNGQTYLNIHSGTFPGGEIRGTITAPEPASVVLLGSGLLGFLLVRRRQLAARRG